MYLMTEPEKLIELFKIGYNSSWNSCSPSQFNGDFLCALLGYAFRKHKISPPRRIERDEDGFLHYIDDNLNSYGFLSSGSGILLVDQNGVSKHLECYSKTVFSTMENSHNEERHKRALSNRLTA